MISAFVSTFELGLSMFVAYLFAQRVSYSNVYRPLMLFFAANSLVLLCFIIREPSVHNVGFQYLSELTLFKLIVELTLPPLVWIYVRELTSEHGFGFQKSDSWHFVFPLIPCVLVAIATSLFSPNAAPEDSVDLLKFVRNLNEILNIIALLQFCVYVGLIMFRLAEYRKKLMDLFSSTENLELKWFRIILVLFIVGIGLELIAEFRYAMTQRPNPFVPWNNLLRLTIIWLLAVWGLRQRPALRIETNKTNANTPVLEKYEKSAIPNERLIDISFKIKKFLEVRKGYRDSDLSLRTMAKIIGVRPDYVSQTLSRHVGESFFDYVNRLRAKEAMELITETDRTVAEIASSVGFNSRSSFYKAFKKETGCTPTAYRNTKGIRS